MTTSFLETRIPPPIVALVSALLMWLMSQWIGPQVSLSPFLKTTLIALFTLSGLAFDISALIAFRKARTTINPLNPANANTLVASGVYRITRNPMYVGLMLFLCAWAVYLQNWMTLGIIPLAMLYLNRYQIQPEERALLNHFGEAYKNYQQQVRRWL